MPTPEGKVKKEIDKILKLHSPKVWYHKAVVNGMGKPTLDYTGSAGGMFFAIEAKAPGKEPTERQQITIKEIQMAGGKVFVIDGDTTELEVWLEGLWENRSS